ncbi:Marine sediment metagenome DNA, contig: S01H1_C01699 (Fragment) OS=marine sediment metagenome GN=S01H1_03183 PE=4 SV=1: Terminase_6 [Tuwongella immobilis]|uniref:Terminase large subunit gp17-like C-terminal domain-containing protein n=1 Tax=Tuwongella immobilis TaxID=692036 RepID=A0A6C2YQN9_9BACT
MSLYPVQLAFRRSTALYRGFCGGIGSGKSWVGAYDLLARTRPGRLYLVVAPSYRTLRDATFRTFRSIAEHTGFWGRWHKSDFAVTLGNTAEVLFRSADNPESLRGPNASGVWLDEASLTEREAFTISIGRLREAGEQGWLSATFTPKGRQHWTYEQFATNRPNVALFQAKSADNPFLPTNFAETTRQQYTSHFAAQELDANFLDPAGAMMRENWFPVVETLPERLTEVRYWDLAATSPDEAEDPDWSVGIRMGRAANKGAFYIRHMARLRESPAQVQAKIIETAKLDGKNIPIVIEREPGSAGKSLIQFYARELAGWVVREHCPTGDKVTRAHPFAAMAEQGLVYLLRGHWNRDWLDEISLFPMAKHDDIVDASTGAFRELVDRPAFRLI